MILHTIPLVWTRDYSYHRFPEKNTGEEHQKMTELFFWKVISPIFPKHLSKLTWSFNQIFFSSHMKYRTWLCGQYLLGCDVSKRLLHNFLKELSESFSGIWWWANFFVSLYSLKKEKRLKTRSVSKTTSINHLISKTHIHFP